MIQKIRLTFDLPAADLLALEGLDHEITAFRSGAAMKLVNAALDAHIRKIAEDEMARPCGEGDLAEHNFRLGQFSVLLQLTDPTMGLSGEVKAALQKILGRPAQG